MSWHLLQAFSDGYRKSFSLLYLKWKWSHLNGCRIRISQRWKRQNEEEDRGQRRTAVERSFDRDGRKDALSWTDPLPGLAHPVPSDPLKEILWTIDVQDGKSKIKRGPFPTELSSSSSSPLEPTRCQLFLLILFDLEIHIDIIVN